MKQLRSLLIILVTLILANKVAAQDLPRTWLCSNMNKGTYMGAPNWTAIADTLSGQEVLVEYKGNSWGHISWFRDSDKYHEGPAIAMSMNSGMAFVMFGEEFVETYIVNVSTMELLYTSIRSGSAVLPNAVKSSRGTCVPAGALSK